MKPLAIDRATTINISLVLALLSGVGTSGYFVGTAHSRINEIEANLEAKKQDDRESLRLLLEIDRRISRIEGKLSSIDSKIKP